MMNRIIRCGLALLLAAVLGMGLFGCSQASSSGPADGQSGSPASGAAVVVSAQLHSYEDPVHSFRVTYPANFAAEGTDDGGVLYFYGKDGEDADLLFYVYANTHGSDAAAFAAGVGEDVLQVEQYGTNGVILRLTHSYSDTMTDYTADYYYLGERYTCWVSIQCKTPEIADQWYAALQDGAVSITHEPED